ncbi:hypothetical protein CJI58_000480 [Bifidobacteriaceae bacterium NR047]|nr:hypothetical protein [Bifidobacteriaceae bacterium NR047]
MMNKKFIATFAAAAMLCCVCNAGVAVADESTTFQTTITQLVNEADSHIDSLKNIVNAQDDAELKKDLARVLLFINKQNIQDAHLKIEKFEKDLAAAGDSPDQATLKTLKDEHYAAQSAWYNIFTGTNHNYPMAARHLQSDPFTGYSDYSRWLKEAMYYGKISDANAEILKLKTIKAKIADFAKSIKLPSEINPENIDDKCDHEFKRKELDFWYDGAADASNTKYVAAQLDYWRKDLQYIKNKLKDIVAKSARGLVADIEYDLEGRIYQLTSKVEATMNIHDGEEYLKQQLPKYHNLEDAFRHNVTEYNDFGITQDQSSTPTEDPNFDYDAYGNLEHEIETLYDSPSFKELYSKYGDADTTKMDSAARKQYLKDYEKHMELQKTISKLEAKRDALGKYPDVDHKPTTDSRTARPGAISYAYLQLKFKKYVQNLLKQGKNLENWLAENKPAYDAIFRDREKDFGNVFYVPSTSDKYPKYLESYFKQHRYEFIRDLVASQDNKQYVKDALKNQKTYAEMIEDTNDSLKGIDTDTYNKRYLRIKFIEHLQEYGNDEEVARMLNTDDLALTPEQKSSESAAPIDYNNSSFDNFGYNYNRRKNHNTNPGGGSGNGSGNDPDGNDPDGNNPDGNNPEGGNPGGGSNGGSAGGPTKDSGDDSDDFNWDDFNWDDLNLDDLNLDDLNLDDLNLDDLNSKHTQPDNPQSKKNKSENPQTNNTDVDDFNIDDFNIDDFDLDDLDLSDLDLSNFYNDNTQSNNAKPKKNKSENPQTSNTNVDDFNIDDFDLDDFDLSDFDLSDFYNDDTQSDDTQSGKTNPEVAKTNVTNSEDTKPTGAQSDGAINNELGLADFDSVQLASYSPYDNNVDLADFNNVDAQSDGAINGEPDLADLDSVQFASYPPYYNNGKLTDSNNVGAQSDGAINNEPGLADLDSVQFASYSPYDNNVDLADFNNAESK